MKPVLAIDARWLKTGIGRYTHSVMKAVRNQLTEVEVIGITQPEYEVLVRTLCDEVIVTRTQIYTPGEQFELPRLARRASVFYAPHFNAPLLWRGRLLVTIHDLTHLIYPNSHVGRTQRMCVRALMRMAAAKAHHLITPSEYTRSMIVKHLGIPSRRISVAPCSVTAPFSCIEKSGARRMVARTYGISCPYLIYVGNLAPHKNVALLLTAMCCLQAGSHKGAMLVIVSNDRKWKPVIEAHIRSLDLLCRVAILEGIDDAQLAELYAGACATVMPSHEEGFGLPIIESMACGTPVICSNKAAMPEVAGGAALLFDPEVRDSLSEALKKLFHNQALEGQLISAGLARAQLFSPAISCGLQVSLIRSALAC